jgi:hypothetical protein
LLRAYVIALVILAALAGGGQAQDRDLRELSWMSGCWLAGDAESWTEEIWSTPGGGLLLGTSRSVSAGRATTFEYMRIEWGPNGTALIASPSGRPGTTFPAVAVDRTRLRVERPDHDFPRAIEYHPIGADSLVARVFGEVDAAEPRVVLHFGRVDCPGTAR